MGVVKFSQLPHRFFNNLAGSHMIVSILQLMGFPLGKPVHSRAVETAKEESSSRARGHRKDSKTHTQATAARSNNVKAKSGKNAVAASAIPPKSTAKVTSKLAPKGGAKQSAKVGVASVVKGKADSKAVVKAQPKAVVRAKSAVAAPKVVAKALPKAATSSAKKSSKLVATSVVKSAAKPATKVASKGAAKTSTKSLLKTTPKPAEKKPSTKPAKALAKPVAKAPLKSSAKVPKAIATPATKPVAKPVVKVPVKSAKVVQSASVPLTQSVAKEKVSEPVAAKAAKPVAPTAVASALPAVSQKGGRPSSRLASVTVPSMAQSVASTAAKASYSQVVPVPVIVPVLPSSIKKDPKLANNWKSKPASELSDAELMAMADADYMNEAQMAAFRHRLEVLKADILNNAGETTEHLREDTSVVPDPADRATIEEEHALELRTRDRERKLLKKIEQSIARIDAGDYGYCDETGEPIGVGRLLARPTASLSLEAQQRRELKQKMFGD